MRIADLFSCCPWWHANDQTNDKQYQVFDDEDLYRESLNAQDDNVQGAEDTDTSGLSKSSSSEYGPLDSDDDESQNN